MVGKPWEPQVGAEGCPWGITDFYRLGGCPPPFKRSPPTLHNRTQYLNTFLSLFHFARLPREPSRSPPPHVQACALIPTAHRSYHS